MHRAVRDADRADLDLMRDLLEERAALIEEGCRVSRERAENAAARLYGYTSWRDAMQELMG